MHHQCTLCTIVYYDPLCTIVTVVIVIAVIGYYSECPGGCGLTSARISASFAMNALLCPIGTMPSAEPCSTSVGGKPRCKRFEVIRAILLGAVHFWTQRCKVQGRAVGNYRPSAECPRAAGRPLPRRSPALRCIYLAFCSERPDVSMRTAALLRAGWGERAGGGPAGRGLPWPAVWWCGPAHLFERERD